MNQTTLLRYNFRVMMMNNWLLMVFPLVISQLSVFWFVLTRKFSAELPTQSVEMVTPLLAAFLGAHLLSAEYKSRIGAVLASRPINIGRIVVMRLGVMLALVWALGFLSLLAYYFWMEPYSLVLPIIACIPSTLFLTMLSITFATLFRHSLSGFGIAALYWAFDLVPGAPLHPYISLRSLTSYYTVLGNADRQAFLDTWWIAKIVLLAAAFGLYLFHDRLVFTLGSSQTIRTRRRASLFAAGLLIFYLVSGAAIKVTYGYAHRGSLPPSDLAWFRYQFAPYGPIPVAPLFGGGFTRYIGEITNPWRLPEGEEADLLGDTLQHQRKLADVVENMPNSMWAPSAADALARLEAHRQKTPDEAAAYYRRITERYSTSPYTEYALRQTAHVFADANRADDARTTYMEMLKRHPESIYRSEAYRFLVEMDKAAGHLPEAAGWAEKWTNAAPLQEKFDAWMNLAVLRQKQGDSAGAKDAAQQVLKSVKEFRKALDTEQIKLSPSQTLLRNDAARRAEADAKAMQ